MNLLETAEMHKQDAIAIKEASEIKALQHMADYHKTMISISEEANDFAGIERNQAELMNCLISLGITEATEPDDNQLVESYTVSNDGRYVITAHAVVGSVQERPEISHVVADPEKASSLGLHVSSEAGKYGKTTRMSVTDRKTDNISHFHVYQSDVSNGKPSFYVRGIGGVRPHDEQHKKVLTQHMSGNLNEEADNSAYDAWKNEVEQTHPQHRGTVRYIGFNDPTHGACVNAHVPGADKSLGVYTLSKNSGHVLTEAEDTDSADYRVTASGHKARAKHARHKSENDANKDDKKIDEAIDNGPVKVVAPTISYGQSTSTGHVKSKEELADIKATQNANRLANRVTKKPTNSLPTKIDTSSAHVFNALENYLGGKFEHYENEPRHVLVSLPDGRKAAAFNAHVTHSYTHEDMGIPADEMQDTSETYHVKVINHPDHGIVVRHSANSNVNESSYLDESWEGGANSRQKEKDNETWDSLFAKHSDNPEVTKHLKDLRVYNWKPEPAEGEAVKRATKVEESKDDRWELYAEDEKKGYTLHHIPMSKAKDGEPRFKHQLDGKTIVSDTKYYPDEFKAKMNESIQLSIVNALLEDDVLSMKKLTTTLLDLKAKQLFENIKKEVSK